MRGELGAKGDPDEVLLDRQALHARCLKLAHPISGEPLQIEAPMPADIEAVLEVLRQTP
jgi:23S rRNA pseudouridine1911/1915/1917 synthase